MQERGLKSYRDVILNWITQRGLTEKGYCRKDWDGVRSESSRFLGKSIPDKR